MIKTCVFCGKKEKETELDVALWVTDDTKHEVLMERLKVCRDCMTKHNFSGEKIYLYSTEIPL